MKKLYCYIFFLFWIGLSMLEIVAPYVIPKEKFYWRAWEYVVNDESSNLGSIPFKPRMDYTGTIYGDMTRGMNIKPSKDEVRRQVLKTDEYGYRNEQGMLDKPIDAVLFGSSQVVGLADSQENIIGTILTKKYNIPSYTYPKASLQQFLLDTRFQESKPKYVIIIGRDYEFRTIPYIYEAFEKNERVKVKNWLPGEWEKKNSEKVINKNYSKNQDYANRFSITRVLLSTSMINILNSVFTRDELVSIFSNNRFSYDKSSDIFFSETDPESPLIDSPHKSKKDVDKVINSLTQTSQILKKRGITLIVGVMPTKSALYDPRYKNVPLVRTEIWEIEKALDKSSIAHIPLPQAAYSYAKNNSELLYYNDDSHWNAQANKLIARLIYEKIDNLSKKEY